MFLPSNLGAEYSTTRATDNQLEISLPAYLNFPEIYQATFDHEFACQP